MKSFITFLSSGIIIVSTLMMPASVSAQLTPGNTGLTQAAAGSGLSTGCSGSECLAQIVGRLINVVLGFLGIVLLAIVIYAGFTWMTAGGEADKVQKAKSMLVNAVAGIIIVASSYAIASFVITQLGSIAGGGGGSTGSSGDFDCDASVVASACPSYVSGGGSTPDDDWSRACCGAGGGGAP